MKIEEVLRKAIRMEEEGREFYSKAGSCTANPMGQKMFETLANDEIRHKRYIEGLLKNMTPDEKELEDPLPKERLKSVFAGINKDVCKTVPPTQDDIDALEFAMGKETDSYELYKGAAEQATDPKVRAVLERIAREENHHFEILEQTKYYLEEFANWTLWEEGGPIEGG